MRKGKKRKIKINKLRLVTYAVIVLLIVYFGVSAMKIIRLSGERDEVSAYNEELTHEKESLELKLENISSPDYIESLARADLKLVKPNELIFVFPQEDGDEGKTDSDAQSTKDADKTDDASEKDKDTKDNKAKD